MKKIKLQQIVKQIETDQLKSKLPFIYIGDTVKVGVLIQEGDKQRVQPYQGTVIAQHRNGMNSTVTIRRVFQGIGVERIFPLHSPSLKEIKIIKQANVRRAKLHYLRDRVGKGTRLKEKKTFKKQH